MAIFLHQSCVMVPRWQFFGNFLHPVFSASHVQQILHLHSKFALRLHHVLKYGRNLRPLRLDEEKKEQKRKEETGQKYDVRVCYTGRP